MQYSANQRLINLSALSFITVSQDGKKLLSGYKSGIVKVWDLSVSHKNGIVKMWSSQTKNSTHISTYPDILKEIASFVGHPTPVISVVWSRDEQILVIGSQDKSINIHDLQTGKTIYHFTLKGNYKNITAIAFTSDRKIFAGAFDFVNQTGKVWNLLNNTSPLCILPKYTLGNPLTFSPDAASIVINCQDNKVRIYNWQDEREVSILKASKPLNHAAFSTDGKMLVSSGIIRTNYKSLHTLQVWDVETGEKICTLSNELNFFPIFSPNGKTIICANYGYPNKINIWGI